MSDRMSGRMSGRMTDAPYFVVRVWHGWFVRSQHTVQARDALAAVAEVRRQNPGAVRIAARPYTAAQAQSTAQTTAQTTAQATAQRGRLAPGVIDGPHRRSRKALGAARRQRGHLLRWLGRVVGLMAAVAVLLAAFAPWPTWWSAS